MRQFMLVAVLAVLATVSAKPTGILFGGGTATGTASGQSTLGTSTGPLGTSVVGTDSAQAGGTAQGLGSLSASQAFANTQKQQGLLGASQVSNTGAVSNQNTQPGFPGFPAGFPVVPGVGGIQGVPFFQPSSATGQAQGQVTQGTSVGIDGTQTQITSVSSSAGGSATAGGSSINQANASQTSQSGLHGTSQSSNTGATSVQTGRR